MAAVFKSQTEKRGYTGKKEPLIFLIHLCDGSNTKRAPKMPVWKCNNDKSFVFALLHELWPLRPQVFTVEVSDSLIVRLALLD